MQTHLAWSNPNRMQFTLIALFVAYQLLDLITTRLGLLRGIAEGNLIPALLLQTHGVGGLAVLKLGTTALLLAVILAFSVRYRRIWLAMRIINVITCVVVVSNLLQVLRIG